VLVVSEANVFFFVFKVCLEHGPYSGSFFKVDLHLGCCFPLSKPDPYVDQFSRVRSFVEGKHGGTKWFA